MNPLNPPGGAGPWDVHHVILSMTGASSGAAITSALQDFSPATVIPAVLSALLTIWQWGLLRRKELHREQIREDDDTDRAKLLRRKRALDLQHEQEEAEEEARDRRAKREAARRAILREQDRLDAEQRVELAKRLNAAGVPLDIPPPAASEPKP